MGTAPTISVITVTRNLIDAGRRDVFLKVLDCVQAQTHDRVEHVIFDGLSEDGTADLIRAATGAGSGRHPVVFESAADTGLYDAMNKAVALSSGDYVVFLNSDDSLASETVFADLVAVIGEDRPDYIYGATIEAADGRDPVTRRPNLDAVLQRMPFSHNSVLIRKPVFENLGGHDVRFRVAADYDLVLRMVAAGYTGLDAGMAISVYNTRGVSSDADRVGDDYAAIWLGFFADLLPEAQTYSQGDAVRWYRTGHFPLRLCWRMMNSGRSVPALGTAARHSLFKSLRRAVQPWRNYGG